LTHICVVNNTSIESAAMERQECVTSRGGVGGGRAVVLVVVVVVVVGDDDDDDDDVVFVAAAAVVQINVSVMYVLPRLFLAA
jgi:hypothetical protein